MKDSEYVYVIAFDPHDGFWWAMERGNNARAASGATPLEALRELTGRVPVRPGKQ